MSDPKHRLSRQAAVCLEALEQISAAVEEGHPADRLLQRFFKERRFLGSRDRRLIATVVFGYFRWKGWIDPRATDPEARAALALRLEAEEAPPILSALGADAPEMLGGRTLAEKAEALGAELQELVPAWVAGSLPEDELAPFIQACQQRPPAWIRIRRKRREGLLQFVASKGFEVQRLPGLPDALAFPVPAELQQLKEAVGRDFEIQDSASQVVSLACAPAPGEHWWDACAGSGGKALHLLDLMEDRGTVLATDRRESMMKNLSRRTGGRAGVTAACMDVLSEAVPGVHYHGVLVDAPCSGLGTWARNPDARWRTPEKQITQNARRQLNLLKQVCQAVKPGGKLVYAVCSLALQESADVREAFLAAHPEFSSEELVHPFSGESGPQLRIRPWECDGDGMYVASFRRGEA